MSRLYEFFLGELYENNPRLYEEHQRLTIESSEAQMLSARQEWIDGVRSPLTHPISEWVALGKPNVKNQPLKDDYNLDHIFGDVLGDLNKLVNETFKQDGN